MTAPSPWRSLLPVFAACAAIGLQAGVALPLVPLALERQGVDRLTIGIFSAAGGGGKLATATRIPPLAGRSGRVPPMFLSLVVAPPLSAALTYTATSPSA